MGKIFQWIGVKNVNEKFSSILSISASPKPQKSGAPEKLEPFIFYRLTNVSRNVKSNKVLIDLSNDFLINNPPFS